MGQTWINHVSTSAGFRNHPPPNCTVEMQPVLRSTFWIQSQLTSGMPGAEGHNWVNAAWVVCKIPKYNKRIVEDIMIVKCWVV